MTPPLALALDQIPGDLRARARWVLWTWVTVNGTPKKSPYQVATPTRAASSIDSATWATFDAAAQAFASGTLVGRTAPCRAAGIAFVLGRAPDGVTFCAFAIHACRAAETGALDAEALELITRLDSYTEVLPNGTDVQVLLTGTTPADVSAWRKGRYLWQDYSTCVPLTGCHVAETPTTVNERTAALAEIVYRFAPPEPETLVAEPVPTPSAPALSPADEQAIAQRVRQLGIHDEAKRRFAATRAPVLELDDDALTDATTVIAEGRRIATAGVKYVVEGMVPDYGMVGTHTSYAKVGKTTLAQWLGGAVAMGRDFLGQRTTRRRVLVIAAEDPPEYTAWVARHLDVTAGTMTFYRRPLRLDPAGLAKVSQWIRQGDYGLVLLSSWQAVVRGLIRDENDNAGTASVMEDVKAVARQTGIPWLIDAHSGKGEDQSDEADPAKAMRGASAAAGAADFGLSLRYAHSPFSTQRKLSGKGRFVSFAPLLLDYEPTSGRYTVLGDAGAAREALRETTYELIATTGAFDSTPRSETEIAERAGLVNDNGRVTATHRKQVRDALADRDGVIKTEAKRRGQKTRLYHRIMAAA